MPRLHASTWIAGIGPAPRRRFAVVQVSALVITVLAASAAGAAETTVARSVPDFGIMLNDDGGLSFTEVDAKKSEAALRKMLRSLAGSGVKTLIYQVAAGSEIMLYPTQVGSAWGWREAPGETKPPWNVRMPALRAAAAAGLDAGRIAAEEAKGMGLYFLPGYRLNDGHFAAQPFDHPATGRFWIENHERLRIGRSPSDRLPYIANLLDYSHAEVRDHRLAIISEIIDRYSDVMDGLLLDGVRQPFLFPPGAAESGRPLLTEFVEKVRKKLDDAGRRQGRFLPLLIRVPPALEGCDRAGFDVRVWLERRLVDGLVLSPSMTLAFDMPLDQFTAPAVPVGVKIYAALFRRTPQNRRFSIGPTADDYRGVAGAAAFNASPAQVRGAVNNYRNMGAAGLELYNFDLPATAATLDVVGAIAEPRRGDRIYAVTQSYAPDREELVEYRKQIPVKLTSAAAVELSLYIGEPLADRNLRDEGAAALRLGLRGVGGSRPTLVVEINGRAVYDGPLDAVSLPVEVPKQPPKRNDPPRVETYAQIRLTDGAVFRDGSNRLTLRLRGPGSEVEVVEVQLLVTDNER
jgi:hypothetical protein